MKTSKIKYGENHKAIAHVSVVKDNGSVSVQRRLEGKLAFSLPVLQPHLVPLHHEHIS